MERRDFIKKTGFLVAMGIAPSIMAFGNNEKIIRKNIDTDNIKYGNWKYLGKTPINNYSREKKYKCEVAVIGGGIAGICAAVAASRHGAKTILIQNRAVLGGNASSEVHVPINGSYHFKNKFGIDRETGIVEELQLENRYYNIQNSWEVWDHVLYDYVTSQDNLELLLDTQAREAVMNNNIIKRAICYQFTTESKIIVDAALFIDCSGDGLFAVSAGADYRSGREGKEEFGEKYAPDKPDGWVMGDSIQFSTKDMGYPVKFIPPRFTIKYDPSKAKARKIEQLNCGFWWVELGSEFDIIGDTEDNRNKLLGYLYGAWDYVKNSGKYPQAENLALNWVGSLPGRRESRRFVGDYILNEKDLTQYRHFNDTVAYGGGWSLDEHCPGGILNSSDPPSYFHQYFTKMFEIPFRCLYSCNIGNLMFAGRNASMSHIALSATRLIAICALMGQAAGTAAAMCVEKKRLPRDIYKNHIDELQEILLRDDVFIPNRPACDKNDLALKAQIHASSTCDGDAILLTDGISRDEISKDHHWCANGSNAFLTLKWEEEQVISKIEIKCDTNLHTEIEIHPNVDKMKNLPPGLPREMIKEISAEAFVGNNYVEIAHIDNNLHRLIKLSFDKIRTKSIKINLLKTYGSPKIKLYEIRCY